MKKIVWVAVLCVNCLFSFSRSPVLKGYVCDALTKESLPGATVVLQPGGFSSVSGSDGVFTIEFPRAGACSIRIGFVGYEPFEAEFYLHSDTVLHFHLRPVSYVLNEVLVGGENGKEKGLESAVAREEVGRSFFLKNNASNFSKTLSKVAGVSSMDIGAGASKPVIRGMGFNRLAVADKGIVQQNQQWGADHGLDIDQYDIDRVRVHKGPMSLFFGSDAIGGVIEILPVEIPARNQTWGDLSLIAKSNNSLLGLTAMGSMKRDRLFVRGRITAQTFGDYRIPADTVTYLTWKMPIAGRRLANSAGRELNVSLSANYSHGRVGTWVHVSDVFSKTGFFPGAHGIPDINRLKPGGSSSDIELPYSSSNHFKISSTTEVDFNDFSLRFNVGFQQNRRAEMALFHTHYANQPAPRTHPHLELSLLLNTFSANGRILFDNDSRWKRRVGFSAEYQRNRVGGYSFLMPAFRRFTAGAFAAASYKASERASFTGGIRYDGGSLNVRGFYDETLESYLRTSGYDEIDARFYARRADALNTRFHALSGGLGMTYSLGSTGSLKANIGRSFRFPSAGELASNGVHHGAFRHEKGNPGLNPETGWQLDLSCSVSNRKWMLSVHPYVAFFPNYIYLNPTGIWSVLPHTGQIYEYMQSPVFSGGGEIEIGYRFSENLLASANWGYVYSRNADTGYPLPFSPPANLLSSLLYSNHGKGALMRYSVGIENRTVLAQHRLSKNEEATLGTSLFDLLCSMNWKVGRVRFFTYLQVQNLFDRPFYNHLSFYRKLNVPEPGRNIQMILKIPF